MIFKRIDHVELTPRDLEVTLRFYTDILGFTLKERIQVGMPPLREIAFLTLGDTMIELLGVDHPAPVPQEPWPAGYRGIALEVSDMDQAVAYLQEKGVPITWGPMDMGPSKRAEIQDPDGFTIELRQWQRG